ncbi:g7208 [Coccomyxa viridis]|uniref:G7208 protein n=1 Tax=Coccomyxa viridis TaxID=1274662 RepID=A0ABP1FZQ4_9CHLO
MISTDAVWRLDYFIMAVSGLTFLACMGAALAVVPWTKAVRKLSVLVEFSIFWKARLFLVLIGAFWVLSQWLRLEAIWEPGSHIMPERVTAWGGEGWMCRIYLCISLGMLQPLFLLTAMLLCQQSISRRKNIVGNSPNKHVLGLACAWSVPLAVVQIIIAWVSLGFEDEVDLQHSSSVLHHFFAPYTEGTPSECGSAGSCTRCYFPAAACIASVIFCVVVGIMLWRASVFMIHRVINRTLQRRLRTFLGLFVSALFVNQAAQSASVAASPFQWGHQIAWLISFLALPVLVGATVLLLVVLPALDTLSAGQAWKHAGGRLEEGQGVNGSRRHRPPEANVELSNSSEKAVQPQPQV